MVVSYVDHCILIQIMLKQNRHRWHAQMAPSFAQRMPTEQVKLGFSIIGRYVYTVGITVNRDVVKEVESMPESMLTIHGIYDMLRVFREEKVLSVLREYLHLSEESMSMLKRIGELEFVDLRKFASLLLLLVNISRYKVTDVSLVEDLETGELQFVSVHIDNCGWKEWKILSKFPLKLAIQKW
jgi:hypothetical protein